MRILVVTQYFWPENFRINDLVSELTDRGHEVTVLTGYPNYPDGKVFPQFRSFPASFAQFGAAEVVRVPLSARGTGKARLMLNYLSFALSASFAGSWKLRGKKFDAIVAYEPSPITVGIPAAIMRWLKRAPMVFWVLDLWPETLIALGVVRAKLPLFFIRRLVSWIYARCDLILAQSNSFIPQIRRYCSDANRIRYFPSWAEGVFDLVNAQPAPEVPVRADVFTIVFAGNIGDAQDFPSILKAATLLKSRHSVRWIIVGDGRAAAWVAEEVVRLGLQESVSMLGRFPVERMPSFYKHADALLVSLRSDEVFSMTIPGKVQSYLASGVPILAMLDGEGAQVVDDNVCGLTCRAGDSQGLAAAVLRLVAMTKEERAKLGENGKRVCAIEFNRGSQITKLETWLHELSMTRSR